MIYLDSAATTLQKPPEVAMAATRAIRQLDRPDAGSIPILAMTANAFVEDRRRAYEAGMNEHLPKPLDAPKLILLIRKYLRV